MALYSPLNEALGPRWSLVVAAGLYSLYVLSPLPAGGLRHQPTERAVCCRT